MNFKILKFKHLGLLLVLLFSGAVKSQTATVTPDLLFNKVYDHYGNEYDFEDIHYLPVKTGTVMCTNSGYFELYFDTGSGFEQNTVQQIQRRDVICQVFKDISDFIVPVNVNQKVRIWIRDIAGLVTTPATSSVLAVASSFYTMPTTAPGVSGIVDGQIWKTINTGTDAYLNSSNPLYSNGNVGTLYHGLVAVNFANTGFSWHTDLTALPVIGDQDMYTVLLHEVTHALGHASLIRGDGLSKLSNSGLNYFSRYDSFLQTNSGTPLLTNNSPCSLYGSVFNSALTPSNVLTPNPNMLSCSSNLVTCSLTVKFAGNVNQSVYTPVCFTDGSSLSHLEDRCRIPVAYTNPGEYYVMSYANSTGPAFTKRYLKEEERQVLCDLGYKVNDAYGNNLNAVNSHTYAGGMCPGLDVAGVNDATFNAVYNNTLGILGSAILANDHNAVSFECLEDVYGMGTVNITSGIGTNTIVYTPTGNGGMSLLRYVPVSSTGKRGNITYVFISITDNCQPSGCNMVNNSGFENGTGCGNFYLGGNNVHIDCWKPMTNNPIYVSRGCASVSQGTLYGLPTSTNACNPPSESWSGIPGNNNNFLCLEHTQQSVQTTLNTPIINNGVYTLSFWARVASSNYSYGPGTVATATVDFRGDPAAALPPYQFGNWFTGPYGQHLTGVQIPNDGIWHNYTLTFTNTTGQALNSLLVGNSGAGSIFLDDIVLNPGGFSPPTPMCLPAQITNLAQYVSTPGGTFSGTYVETTGAVFSFVPMQEGTYTVSYMYTSTTGCTLTIPAVIDVIKPGTPTVTAGSTGTSNCAGAAVTLTATGANSYTWAPGVSCTSPCSTVIVNPASTTAYTVLGNYAYGCPTSSAVVTVSITNPGLCCAIANSVIANNANSSSHATTLSNITIDVAGIYNINTNMTYNNVIFRMAANSKLVVSAANQLILSNCKFFSCTDMWDGIYLNQNTTQAAGIKVYNGTSIEDAINGIVTNAPANSVIGSNIDIQNAVFNKNYKSMQISNYNGTVIYPLSFKQASITCANSNYSFGNTLKAPYQNQRSSLGFSITSVKQIKIGNSTSATIKNLFNNMDYGIMGTKSSISVVNTLFDNLQGSIPTCFLGQPTLSCYPRGIAIFIPNASMLTNTLTVGGLHANEGNTFRNVLRGIDANYMDVIHVVANTFSCSANSPAFGGTNATTLTGQYGILTANVNHTLNVTVNTLVNYASAISHARNDVYTNTYNPSITILSNSITAIAQGYVNTGIFVSDIASNTITGSSTLFIRNNILSGIKTYGINVYYIKNRPVISGTSAQSQVISMLYGAATSNYGIHMLTCDKALITNNRVTTNNAMPPVTNGNLFGIHLERSTNSMVQCNYLYNTGSGIVIQGDCSGPYTSATAYASGVVANTFTGTACGIRIRVSGKVGTQGDATHPSANVWMGTAASYALGQTLIESSSVAANSILYVASGQIPTNNLPSGSNYIYGTTLLSSTGSSPACPGPSAIEEMPDPLFIDGDEQQPDARYSYVVAGVEPEKKEVLNIYPNPGTGLFYIECDQELTYVNIRVVDMLGKPLLQKQFTKMQKEELDLTMVTKGLYTVEIIYNNKTSYHKLIIQ